MVTVETVTPRTIDGFETSYFIMNRLSFFPYWDGMGTAPTTGYVSISGGYTSMSFLLNGTSDVMAVTKHLNVEGREVLESEVENELIGAGWITAEDTVTVS